MKERPILFQGPMVRGLLREVDPKTQTRRVAKCARLDDGTDYRDEDGWPLTYDEGTDSDMRAGCPYGQPGDRLWVRESWRPDPPDDGTWGYTAWAGERIGRIAAVPERFRHPAFCNYAAGWLHGQVLWTPGIHMPRWASRILLEITEVRVQRLQEISEEDARAEGIDPNPAWGGTYRDYSMDVERQVWSLDPVASYRTLWESINGDKPEACWEANPWVWAVSFRRVQP